MAKKRTPANVSAPGHPWHVDAGDHIEKVNRAATNGPKAQAGLRAGYVRLGDGFPPGSRCDPDHDGDTDYGSTYQNTDGSRVYKANKRKG